MNTDPSAALIEPIRQEAVKINITVSLISGYKTGPRKVPVHPVFCWDWEHSCRPQNKISEALGTIAAFCRGKRSRIKPELHALCGNEAFVNMILTMGHVYMSYLPFSMPLEHMRPELGSHHFVQCMPTSETRRSFFEQIGILLYTILNHLPLSAASLANTPNNLRLQGLYVQIKTGQGLVQLVRGKIYDASCILQESQALCIAWGQQVAAHNHRISVGLIKDQEWQQCLYGTGMAMIHALSGNQEQARRSIIKVIQNIDVIYCGCVGLLQLATVAVDEPICLSGEVIYINQDAFVELYNLMMDYFGCFILCHPALSYLKLTSSRSHQDQIKKLVDYCQVVMLDLRCVGFLMAYSDYAGCKLSVNDCYVIQPEVTSLNAECRNLFEYFWAQLISIERINVVINTSKSQLYYALDNPGAPCKMLLCFRGPPPLCQFLALAHQYHIDLAFIKTDALGCEKHNISIMDLTITFHDMLQVPYAAILELLTNMAAPVSNMPVPSQDRPPEPQPCVVAAPVKLGSITPAAVGMRAGSGPLQVATAILVPPPVAELDHSPPRRHGNGHKPPPQNSALTPQHRWSVDGGEFLYPDPHPPYRHGQISSRTEIVPIGDHHFGFIKIGVIYPWLKRHYNHTVAIDILDDLAARLRRGKFINRFQHGEQGILNLLRHNRRAGFSCKIKTQGTYGNIRVYGHYATSNQRNLLVFDNIVIHHA